MAMFSPKEAGDLDRQIEMLMDCKPLPEADVLSLCKKCARNLPSPPSLPPPRPAPPPPRPRAARRAGNSTRAGPATCRKPGPAPPPAAPGPPPPPGGRGAPRQPPVDLGRAPEGGSRGGGAGAREA